MELNRNESFNNIGPKISDKPFSNASAEEFEDMWNLKSVILGSVLAVAGSGCANQNSIPTVGSMLGESTGQNGRACVRVNDIRGWGALDNGLISIDGAREYYLATLMPGCHDLHTSIAAMFQGSYSEVCGGGMDGIKVNGDNCQIRQMYEFKDREEAFDLLENVTLERERLKQQTR